MDRLEAGLATVPAGSKLVLLDFLEVIYIDSTALETVERYCEKLSGAPASKSSSLDSGRSHAGCSLALVRGQKSWGLTTW